MPPFLIKDKTSFILIFFILDEVWLPSVNIGNCQLNQDLDFNPSSIRAPANNEHVICSPVETKTSCSDFSNVLLIFFDFLIKSSVAPLIAEDTTITLFFWS